MGSEKGCENSSVLVPSDRIAVNRISLSAPSGDMVTLLIHMFPLSPGSCKVVCCCSVIVDGGELQRISRSMVSVSAVRRSHF